MGSGDHGCACSLDRSSNPELTPALPSCHIRLTGRKLLPAAYPRELSTLGDHLRKRRLDLGLLQKELADELGVDEMTICNWETNRTSPQLRFIPRIITFLGSVPDDTQVGGLGQQIVAARCRLGFSQRELARRLGATRPPPAWVRSCILREFELR